MRKGGGGGEVNDYVQTKCKVRGGKFQVTLPFP